MSNDDMCGHVHEPSDGGIAVKHDLLLAIEHPYFAETGDLAANEIRLYEGEFELSGRATVGTVTFELNPSPRVRAVGECDVDIEDLQGLLDGGPTGWVSRPEVKVTGSGFPERSTVLPVSTSDAVWYPNEIVGVAAGGDGSSMDRVTFLVPNGWIALDGVNYCHDGEVRTGMLTASASEWRIRIEPRGDVPLEEIGEHLRSTGNHTITHVGELRRMDRAVFDSDSATEILSTISTALTFVTGRSTGAILPVGWLSGQHVWTDWTILRRFDRPTNHGTIRDEYFASSQVAEVLERCLLLQQNQLGWEVFNYGLGYYLSANYGASVQMQVTLPVSGLLVLGFHHFSEAIPASDPRRVNARQWKALNTQPAIRKYLDVVEADLRIPANRSHLIGVQQRMALGGAPLPEDGLAVLIKMRNDVVHPERARVARWNIYEWAEAGFFAIQLLELSLLHLLKYCGKYTQRASNRGVGTAVDVPWAAAGPRF